MNHIFMQNSSRQWYLKKLQEKKFLNLKSKGNILRPNNNAKYSGK